MRSARGAGRTPACRPPAVRAIALGFALLIGAAACRNDGQEERGAAHEARAATTQTEGRMTKYDWLASNSGPRGCPMEIVDGGFFFPGGGSQYIPPASVHAGWGREVSLHVVGDDKKPLPDSIAVLFFSFLEDKLYRAQFALPHDRIAQLFHEGFPKAGANGGRETYSTLVAGVAPGGSVAVWVSGSERQVEVFFGQAEAVDLDWHRAMSAPPDVDRHAYVASELESAAELDSLVRPMMGHVPVGRWAAYRTRYQWQPVFEAVGAPATLERVEFVNGERDNVAVAEMAADRDGRPAPRFFIFADSKTGMRYRPAFDEAEITAAFARAGGDGRRVELVFAAPAAGTADPQVVVRGPSGTVALQRVTYAR